MLATATILDIVQTVAEITIPALVIGVPAIYAAVAAKRTRSEMKTGNGHTAGQAIDNIAEVLGDLRSEQASLQRKVIANQFRNDLQSKITHARLNEIEEKIRELRRDHYDIEDMLGLDHEDD